MENNIFNLKWIGNNPPLDIHKPILSSCLFKMAPNSAYSQIDRYIRGLKLWIKLLNSKSVYFKYMLLFIDDHIYNDQKYMNIINNCKYIIPILFDAPNYKDGIYHRGLLGTISRLLPIFYMKGVCIVDIDNVQMSLLKLIYKVKDNYDIIGNSFNPFRERVYHPHILCGTLYFNTIIDIELFYKFMKNIDKLADNFTYKFRKNPFSYGIDEFLVNMHLLNKIDANIGYLFEYTYTDILFYNVPKILEYEPVYLYCIVYYLMNGKNTPHTPTYLSHLTHLDAYQEFIKYDDYLYKSIIEKKLYNKRQLSDLSLRFYNIMKYLSDKKLLPQFILTYSLFTDIYFTHLHNYAHAYIIYSAKNKSIQAYNITTIDKYSKISEQFNIDNLI